MLHAIMWLCYDHYMTAQHKKNGEITITYNPHTSEKLYSPDGTLHLLACDDCGRLEWVSTNVVAVVCDPCANSKDPEPPMSNSEYAYYMSCTNGSVYRD
jgi:hypothetical protein